MMKPKKKQTRAPDVGHLSLPWIEGKEAGILNHKGSQADCRACAFIGPRSVCTCNHSGAGIASYHVDGGKGRCITCKCPKFVFKSHLPGYARALEEAKGVL